MLQPKRLVEAGLLLVHVERRHAARVEDRQRIDDHLDLPGRQLRVRRACRTGAYLAADLDDPLVACRLAGGVSLGRIVGRGDDLGDAITVAEVEEGELAMVATAVDPARQRDPLPDRIGTQLAAGMGAQRRGARARRHGSAMVADGLRIIGAE